MWRHFYKIIIPKITFGTVYYLEALFTYALIKLKGSTPNKRLRNRSNICLLYTSDAADE